MTPEQQYRPCVGIMLLSDEGNVFVGQRIDNPGTAWQMPQGGIDDGEKVEQAALRELEEETGISPQHVVTIGQTADWLYYDLPAELQGKLWGGAYKGQRQHWFLMRFHGSDSDINIQTSKPEFSAWKWVEPSQLPELIVPFKRALYQELLAVFKPSLERA